MTDIVEELRHWETVAHSYDAETLGKAAAEIERLRSLVDACSVYLKEDETPAQRIERERADTEAVLKLLLKEKRAVERLRKDLAEKDDYIRTVSRPMGAHSYE